jgi:hypothetical protein
VNTDALMVRSGLTRTMVRNWQNAGYLVPLNAIGPGLGAGKGTPLDWSQEEADKARLMVILMSEAGFTTNGAWAAAEAVKAAVESKPRAVSHTVDLDSIGQIRLTVESR